MKNTPAFFVLRFYDAPQVFIRDMLDRAQKAKKIANYTYSRMPTAPAQYGDKNIRYNYEIKFDLLDLRHFATVTNLQKLFNKHS